MRKLDDWLKGFLLWKDRSEAPLLYRTWTGLSVIAAALQRKCYTVIEGKVFPNMFVALIGPSGIRKGTAMSPGLSLLNAVGIKLSSNAVTRQALIRALRKSGDSGVPIIGGKLAIHSSLTVFSKEFTVFMGYKDLDFVAALCDLYDCDDRWEYGTKNEELSDTITNVWLNMIGATTPDSFISSIPEDAIGGGLTSRIILVYADKEEAIIPDPWNVPAEFQLEKDLITDLTEISGMIGEFEKSEDFLNHRYLDWYEEARKKPPFDDAKFKGYNRRRAIHLIKVCMIVNASRSDDMVLDEQDFDKALEILTATERDMPKVYYGFGRSDFSGVLANVLTMLATHGEMRFGDLLDAFKFDCDISELERLLSGLSKSGHIKITHVEDGSIVKYTGGDRK